MCSSSTRTGCPRRRRSRVLGIRMAETHEHRSVGRRGCARPGRRTGRALEGEGVGSVCRRMVTSRRASSEKESVPQGRVVAVLIPSGTISGRVVDHAGEPLEGISVHAYRDRSGRGTKSGSDGRYTISGLEPGDYELRLTSETRPLPTLTGAATVIAGSDARFDFAVPDPSTFEFFAVRLVATLAMAASRPASPEGERGLGRGRRERRSVSPLACFQNRQDLATGPTGRWKCCSRRRGSTESIPYGEQEVDGTLYRLQGQAAPWSTGKSASCTSACRAAR